MEKIGLLVTPKVDNIAKRIDIHVDHIEVLNDTDILSMMYKHLGCNTVEVIRSKLGDVWIDEEGLFKQGNPVLSFSEELPSISGAMLFSKGADEDGNALWFDKTSIKDLLLIESITKLVSNAELIGFASE